MTNYLGLHFDKAGFCAHCTKEKILKIFRKDLTNIYLCILHNKYIILIHLLCNLHNKDEIYVKKIF